VIELINHCYDTRGSGTLSVHDLVLVKPPNLSISDQEQLLEGDISGIQLRKIETISNHEFTQHCFAVDLDLVHGYLLSFDVHGINLLHAKIKL
jgi:hypothetical protein